MLIYPGFFVELHSDQLAMLDAWGRLRIYSAGVWHNAVLAATSLVLLFHLPTVLSVVYAYKEGAGVVEVLPGSLSNAVYAGDTISSVDGECMVFDSTGWINCLAASLAAFSAGQTGMCVPQATSTALW